MLKVCDVCQFIKRAESLDEIICYGAGQQLGDFVELFKDTIVLDKCKFVADKDKEKQGQYIDFGNFRMSVISPESLKKCNQGSCAVIIICLKFEEIIDYFENDEILKQIDFYCFSYFKLFQQQGGALDKKIPADFKIYKEAIIPKVIHYCWFGGSPLPDRFKRWMESWYKFCPDYDIKEWNESNYDISKNRYMQQAYEHKKWGFVPDYARLDIIYENGGIYLDTDVELIAGLDDLLYQKGFIGFEREDFINLGMGFGAVRGLEIIKELRDDYDDKSFLKEDGSLDLLASPGIQTSMLEKKGLKRNGEYQTVDGLTVYPEKVLGGKNPLTRKIEILPCTRAIHHFTATWSEQERARSQRIEKGLLLAEKDFL